MMPIVSPIKITKSIVVDTTLEEKHLERMPLRFELPHDLSRLSGIEPISLLAPGSSIAVLTVGEDPAAADLMIALAQSCAREGACVLYLTKNLNLNDFIKRLYTNSSAYAYQWRNNNVISIANLKAFDNLNIFYQSLGDFDLDPRIDDLKEICNSIDADLIMVEGAEGAQFFCCLDTAKELDIPVVYNQESLLNNNSVDVQCDFRIPTHILLMDRSCTEEEAEQEGRPYIGTRECRLLIPQITSKEMELPFLGSFTLAYLDESHRITGFVDEYGGHMLNSKIEALVVGNERYKIKEPDHYERRLELYYDD